MNERRAVIQQTFRRYQKADRQHKARILDEFVQLTGYHRAYAALVLRNWGTEHWHVGPRGPLRLVAGGPRKPRKPAAHLYGAAERVALIRLWYLCDCMCAKRLVPAIRTLLPVYERWGELNVSPSVREKLLHLSAATADRLLLEERRRVRLPRGGTHTHPASAGLLSQIPLRTFDEWNRTILGQVQADLVGHDGGLNQGEFAFTCTVTELSVGWSELRPVATKARVRVAAALEDIHRCLPFPIIALGTDTGSEFINNHLYAWCQQHHIEFSRARPYRKNDTCFVEQKNNSLVRHTVGYLRYDTPRELSLLSAIYERQTLLSNYFYPWMKLASKTRRGARVYRSYDVPRTPFQRMLERDDVGQNTKKKLQSIYERLNPAELKRQLTELQNQLYTLASCKPIPLVHGHGPRLAIHPDPARFSPEASCLPQLDSSVRQ